jgi:hypothetical protein
MRYARSSSLHHSPLSHASHLHLRSTIFHPNICLFMGACTLPGNFFIVSEYMPKGDMERMLRDKNVVFSLYQRMKMAKDAALGMNWLHCSNPMFIHRDLKSSNLLVDENGRVKVCDFGLSQIKQHGEVLKDLDSAKGTPLWMAPEVMQFKEFNEKADVYSFGIVLWEIVTRQEPFPHHTNFERFRHAVCVAHERPIIPDDTDPVLRDLIARCWHPVPAQRPSFQEIIDKIDQILVNVAIQDHYGRLFWAQNFRSHDEVSWKEFAFAFMKFMGIPPFDLGLLEPGGPKHEMTLNFRCLRQLLAEKPRTGGAARSNIDAVSLERFGRFLNWFGPITDPAVTPVGHGILDRVRLTLMEPWFHGDTSTEEAQDRLSGKAAGTFLIRFSSVDGWFTISTITDQRAIKHQRIKHKPNFPYVLDNFEFPSLHELVRNRGLAPPCVGSKYQHIFNAGDEANWGYVSTTD